MQNVLAYGWAAVIVLLLILTICASRHRGE